MELAQVGEFWIMNFEFWIEGMEAMGAMRVMGIKGAAKGILNFEFMGQEGLILSWNKFIV